MSLESFVQKIDMVLNDLIELLYVKPKLRREIESDRLGERCSITETGDDKLDQDVSLGDGKLCSNSRKSLKVTGFRNKENKEKFDNHSSLNSFGKLRSKWHCAFY